jgi:hypothetical protein
MGEEKKLEARLKYGDLEATFTGDADEVIRGILKFLSEIYPSYEALSRITLTINAEKLLKSMEGIIAKTREGVIPLLNTAKMVEKDVILLHLLRAHVARLLGEGEKDSLLIGEILRLTRGRAGAVAGRLSELVSQGLVERIGKGEYRITTLGLKRFIEEIIPKYKQGMGGEA